MIVCETERLRLRHLLDSDAPFILELLNEPDFIRNIGDREVRTLEDARRYIQHGPMVSYSQHGFGLFLVELRDSGKPVGICGLLKRDYLQDVDVGFALRESYRGKGYAFEAAQAAMRHGQEDLGISRIVAITSPDNRASMKVLRKLGLEFERNLRIPDQSRDTRLFTPVVRSLLVSKGNTAVELPDEEREADRSADAKAGRPDR
jgi:[ribosomal protein S5]-alanine N-acetyltransferase